MIKGKVLCLRSISNEDMEGIYKFCQNEEFLYMTGTRKSFTLEEITKIYKQFSEDSTRYDFAICLLENNQIIGDLSILEIDQDNKKAGVLRQSLCMNDKYSDEVLMGMLQEDYYK